MLYFICSSFFRVLNARPWGQGRMCDNARMLKPFCSPARQPVVAHTLKFSATRRSSGSLRLKLRWLQDSGEIAARKELRPF